MATVLAEAHASEQNADAGFIRDAIEDDDLESSELNDIGKMTAVWTVKRRAEIDAVTCEQWRLAAH
jgi:hypothetical protein